MYQSRWKKERRKVNKEKKKWKAIELLVLLFVWVVYIIMIIHHYQYQSYAFCLILIIWPIKKHHRSAASWRDLTVQNLSAHPLCSADFILIHNSNGFLSQSSLPTFSTFIFASVLLGSSILQASLQSTPSASPSACCRIHPGSHLPSGN